jgi:hypothetical protein
MDGRPPAWVYVELRDDTVYVDGTPTEGATPADRYQAALRRVADVVASPMGRPVPVWVGSATAVVNRLWVSPDGVCEPFDALPADPRATDQAQVSGSPRASGGGRGWSLGSRRR